MTQPPWNEIVDALLDLPNLRLYDILNPKYPGGNHRIDSKPDPWANFGEIAYCSTPFAHIFAHSPLWLAQCVMDAVKSQAQFYSRGMWEEYLDAALHDLGISLAKYEELVKRLKAKD